MRHLSKKVNENKTTRQQINTGAVNAPVKSTSLIQQLHHSLGNRAVQRLFKSGVIQAKLSVGQPNDKYEQEADRVADQVMRMPDSTAQRQTVEEEPIQTRRIANTITPLIQRQTEPEEEEEAEPEKEEEPEESSPILESVPTRDADELGGVE